MKKEENNIIDENSKNNDFINTSAMLPLLALMNMFSNPKESDLKGIEKQLDEIKWLLAGK